MKEDSDSEEDDAPGYEDVFQTLKEENEGLADDYGYFTGFSINYLFPDMSPISR